MYSSCLVNLVIAQKNKILNKYGLPLIEHGKNLSSVLEQ